MSSGTFPLDNVTFNGKCEQIDEKPIGGSTTHLIGSPRAKKHDLQSPERVFGCIFEMENVDDISTPKLLDELSIQKKLDEISIQNFWDEDSERNSERKKAIQKPIQNLSKIS